MSEDHKGFWVGHKGYIIHFSWDEKEQAYVGTAHGTIEEITVQGETEQEAVYKYIDAIDKYYNS